MLDKEICSTCRTELGYVWPMYSEGEDYMWVTYIVPIRKKETWFCPKLSSPNDMVCKYDHAPSNCPYVLEQVMLGQE